MISYRTLLTEDIAEILTMLKDTSGVRLHENGEDSESGIRLGWNEVTESMTYSKLI